MATDGGGCAESLSGRIAHVDDGRVTALLRSGDQMRIDRRDTKEGDGAYSGIEFRTTKSEIRNPDGSVVFKLDGIVVPAQWSQVASDVLAQKYFRKAGVPAKLKRVEENDVPSFLWRSIPDEAALAPLPESER